MLVMGISCYYHDSAVALVDDDEIRFAIHEERLSRLKHDARFPVLAIGSALKATGLRINDIDRVVFYEEGRFSPGGYLHLTCRKVYFETEDVLDQVLHFSPALNDADREELIRAFETDQAAS